MMKIIAIQMSVQKKERHISRTTQIAHPRPTYTDPPLGVRWGVEYGGEANNSVSRFATSCSPRLEPLGFMLILPFVAILSFGPGMKNVRKWCCLIFLAHTLKYKRK